MHVVLMIEKSIYSERATNKKKRAPHSFPRVNRLSDASSSTKARGSLTSTDAGPRPEKLFRSPGGRAFRLAASCAKQLGVVSLRSAASFADASAVPRAVRGGALHSGRAYAARARRPGEGDSVGRRRCARRRRPPRGLPSTHGRDGALPIEACRACDRRLRLGAEDTASAGGGVEPRPFFALRSERSVFALRSQTSIAGDIAYT